MFIRVSLLAAALAVSVPAQAQSARIDPDHIVSVLKDAGYTAEYVGNEADYRQIQTNAGNYRYMVEMYDCEGGKNCQTLEFYTNFPLPTPPTKEKLDAYDGPREGARLALDRRGMAMMRQELDLGDAGLSDEEIVAKLKTWETMISGVAGYLTRPEGAPAAAAAAPAAEAPATPPAA